MRSYTWVASETRNVKDDDKGINLTLSMSWDPGHADVQSKVVGSRVDTTSTSKTGLKTQITMTVIVVVARWSCETNGMKRTGINYVFVPPSIRMIECSMREDLKHEGNELTGDGLTVSIISPRSQTDLSLSH